MTLQEKNILIARHFGFHVLSVKGSGIELHTLMPPDKHATTWYCNYSLSDSAPIACKTEKEAWESHCPCFFYSDNGLRIMMDWLFENRFNIVHTEGSKIGIRKAGESPENGAYIHTNKVLKEPDFAAAFALTGDIFQPCIATLISFLITRYNADQKAKKASGVIPA